MHPDRITVPGLSGEVDTSSIPAGGTALPAGVASLEIVNGPETSPYGTLVIDMAGDPGSSPMEVTLTRLEIGWEHSGQFLRIKQGTTVTRIRWWK